MPSIGAPRNCGDVPLKIIAPCYNLAIVPARKPKPGWYEASNSAGVRQKQRESRYFLAQMREHENAPDQETFLFTTSAFMSAFRTVANRLCGVRKTTSGTAAGRALMSKLRQEPQVGFLIDRTNLELHGDGAVVLRRYVVERIPGHGRRGRPLSRFEPRESRRWPDVHGVVVRRADGWQFIENPKNLIVFCTEALGTMDTVVDEILNGPGAKSA